MPGSAYIAVAAIDALPAILLNPLLDKASTAASISATAQTVVATILDHAARQPDATEVIQGGHRLTYHQLVTVAPTIAAKLAWRDRKSVVAGKSVPVRVDIGCRGIIKKKN